MTKNCSSDAHSLGILQKYRGLVLKLSWECWRRLPPSTKAWVDPEDLIEEVYIWMLNWAIDTWDESRGNQTTYFYIGIKNMLLRFVGSQQTQKRFGIMLSLDETVLTSVKIQMRLSSRDQNIEIMEAEEALNKTYRQASMGLQHEMRRWFGPEKPKALGGPDGASLKREFRFLAKRNHLTCADCRSLMGCGIWIS